MSIMLPHECPLLPPRSVGRFYVGVMGPVCALHFLIMISRAQVGGHKIPHPPPTQLMKLPRLQMVFFSWGPADNYASPLIKQMCEFVC